MQSTRSPVGSAIFTAMLGAAIVSAQFWGGKAVRDALYLSHLAPTTLPAMISVTALLSIAIVALSSRIITRLVPSRFVSVLFIGSAALLLIEWLVAMRAPKLVAIVFYLHVSGLGPMLGSGFWLIATERFDPHTAKQRFGQIAAAGTLGGLVGGLIAYGVAEITDILAMLPLLAAMNLFCAWQVVRLADPHGITRPAAIDAAPELMPIATRSGLRALADAPYLRNLAALVLLGTLAAGVLDYVFRSHAATLVAPDNLGRFFGLYYAATSLLTFVLQSSASRRTLEKFGLAATTASPSLAVLAGGLVALLAPGLRTAAVIAGRGGESIFRASLFRSGYELFYTPLALNEKRAAKSIIDVGFDRLGELTGAGAIQLAIVLAPAASDATLLMLALVSSVAALICAARLNQGYIGALERSLLNRAVELDLSEVDDLTTRSVMLRTLWGSGATTMPPGGRQSRSAAPVPPPATAHSDPELQHILALRSRDRQATLSVLKHDDFPGALIPHIIQLLAWDDVAEEAAIALRKVAEYRVGEYTDALLDPNQPFAIRRRLARVFAVCVSQRAADGLINALDDLRFEVRFQCARSLASILQKNPRVRVDPQVIYQVVDKEVGVSRGVWEGHRLLDRFDEAANDPFLDEALKGRASQSLMHVFTLLSLVLPTEPLRIAFRGLHTTDPNLRGTSLEYLEGVLPPAIHRSLRPLLEGRQPGQRASRPQAEILADLLRSHESITLNLEELKRRARSPRSEADKARESGGAIPTLDGDIL